MSAPKDVGRALAELRAPLQARVVTPPFEQIRGRARRRRLRRAATGGLAAAALALAGILVVPTLAHQDGGSPSSVQVAASGGPTVAAVPAGAGLSAEDSTLLADGSGLVLAQRCRPSAGCTGLLLGGDSLTQISALPGAATAAGAQPDATRIANVTLTKTLYAYDPGLFISKDEGATWVAAQLGDRTVIDVAPSRTDVWLLTVGSSGPAEIERSAIGGTQLSVLTASVPSSDATSRLLRPTNDLALVTVPDQGLIEISSDAGAHWTHVSMPAGCSTGASLSVTVNATNWWLLCPSSAGATVWSSTTVGKTWKALTAPGSVGAGAVITAIGPKVAYVSGGSAGLFATHDAGKTWSMAISDGSGVFGQPHVQYTHPDITWVTEVRVAAGGTAESQIWHSSDGGSIWRAAPLG